MLFLVPFFYFYLLLLICLFPVGFGIGLASGSVYLDDLSMAILQLEDHGYISQIEDKYVCQGDMGFTLGVGVGGCYFSFHSLS